jgi:hypothetical protein
MEAKLLLISWLVSVLFGSIRLFWALPPRNLLSPPESCLKAVISTGAAESRGSGSLRQSGQIPTVCPLPYRYEVFIPALCMRGSPGAQQSSLHALRTLHFQGSSWVERLESASQRIHSRDLSSRPTTRDPAQAGDRGGVESPAKRLFVNGVLCAYMARNSDAVFFAQGRRWGVSPFGSGREV